MQYRVIINLFLILSLGCCAQDKGSAWLFRNSLGAGVAERTLVAQEHVVFSWKSFAVGPYARWSCRHSWRQINISPNESYDEFKFNNEFAVLCGWKSRRFERSEFMFLGGPVYRNENARWWPTKGSGAVPFIGRKFYDLDADDVKSFRGMIAGEWAFLPGGNTGGGSILLFASFGSDGIDAGLTLNYYLRWCRTVYRDHARFNSSLSE